jgi:hypothetical protein
MAAGDRTQLFTFTQVADLETQINDQSTGLATKVDQLENNPVYTLIKEYDATFVYAIGYPIKRDGKLYVCNTANTTGAFDALKWTVLGRANSDDVIVESGSDKITIKVASGIPTFEFTDGTLVRNAEFRPDNGRIRLTGSTALSEAGDSDVLVKGDVHATSDKYTFDDTTKRLTQTDAATEVASNDNHVLLKSDVPVTNTEVTYDSTAKRISVVEDAVSTASDDKHVLTKKDADALYLALAKPMVSFDIDADVNSGGFLPFTGNEEQINSGFTVQSGTDETNKYLRIDTPGYYRITASLLGYSAESTSGTAATDGTAGSVAFNKSPSVTGTAARFHQIRWYSNTTESYKNLHASVIQPFNQNEVLSFTVSGLAVYGSNGDYSSINVEYIRPL